MAEYKRGEVHRVTNVRLPAETLRKLRIRAAEEGKSIAQLLRESTMTYLESHNRPVVEESPATDPFCSLGASGHSGLGDGAVAHDRYLYPKPSEASDNASPETVHINERYQITMPQSILQRLGISAGDRLIIETRGNLLILIPEPESYTTRLAGLHAEIWQGISTDDYLKEERQGWKNDYSKPSNPTP